MLEIIQVLLILPHIDIGKPACRHCCYLQIAEKTLANWRFLRQGTPFIKIGGTVRYALADIEKWVLQCRVDTKR